MNVYNQQCINEINSIDCLDSSNFINENDRVDAPDKILNTQLNILYIFISYINFKPKSYPF